MVAFLGWGLNQKTILPLETDIQIPRFSNKQHLLKILDFKTVTFKVLTFTYIK